MQKKLFTNTKICVTIGVEVNEREYMKEIYTSRITNALEDISESLEELNSIFSDLEEDLDDLNSKLDSIDETLNNVSERIINE